MIRKCKECGEELEYNKDNFYNYKGILGVTCKSCTYEKTLEYKRNFYYKGIKKRVEYDKELYTKKRHDLNLTQIEAASKIGISYQSLCGIEQGKYKTVSVKVLDKLNKFYGI